MLRNIGWRYLDNQQEFWVNKTHIAKISVKTKNNSSDILSRRRTVGERKTFNKSGDVEAT